MRSRVLAILVAVVIPLAALGVVIAQRGGSSHSPARLPILAAPFGSGEDATLGAARADAAVYPYGIFVYKAGANLPELGGSGRAYKVSGADADAARHLADAFGFSDIAPDADSTFTNGDAQLTVSPSGFWGYSRRSSGGDVSSSGVAVACAPDGDCPVPQTTVPQRPAGLPSQDEAKKIATELLQRAAIDTDGATITVDDFVTQWSVRIEPVVDDLPTEGMTTTVTIGVDGVVDYANGILGRAEPADTYPVIGTTAAIDRLNKGEGFAGPRPLVGIAEDTRAAGGEVPPIADSEPPSGAAGSEPGSVGSGEPGSVAPGEPTPVPPCDPTTIPSTVQCGPPEPEPPPGTGTLAPPPPQVITITDAEQILLYATSYTGEESWLVPAYRFTTDQGIGPSVLAIDDSFLTTPDQLPTGKIATDPGDPVTIEPAPASDPAAKDTSTGG